MIKIHSFIMVALMATISVSFIACDKDENKESEKKDNPSNIHESVDLGLPSGTLWATCNVGAESSTDYGDYFAWGEITPKSVYSWKTYKYGSDSHELTKYCTVGSNGTVDNKTKLDPSDDVATVNWGNDWCIPTDVQQDELCQCCDWIWISLNGVNGQLVTGPNGNSIFLPAAGYHNISSLNDVSSYGYYWSSSILSNYPDDGEYLYFDSGKGYPSDRHRYRGLSVRPVRMSTK